MPQGGHGGWESMEVKSEIYTTLSECICFMKTGPQQGLDLVSTWEALACFHLGMTTPALSSHIVCLLCALEHLKKR